MNSFKYFLFCQLVIPIGVLFCVALFLGAILLAGAFISWDASILIDAPREALRSMTWVKVRLAWVLLAIASAVWWAVTDNERTY